MNITFDSMQGQYSFPTLGHVHKVLKIQPSQGINEFDFLALTTL